MKADRRYTKLRPEQSNFSGCEWGGGEISSLKRIFFEFNGSIVFTFKFEVTPNGFFWGGGPYPRLLVPLI